MTRPVVPGAFRRQLGSELRLVFSRRRNLALLGVLWLTPVLLGIAVKTSTHGDGSGPAFVGMVTGNGLFLAVTSLGVAMPLFLPLAVGVIAGDSISGEASAGTLRYLLTVPVTRTRVLVMKTLTVLTFVVTATAGVALVGLVTGAALFGLRNVTLLSGDTVSLGSGLLRAAGVAVYVAVSLLGLAAIGLFISTLTEVPIAAMAATIGIAVVVEILDSIPQLGSIRGIFFTHHWLGYGELLRRTVDVPLVARWLSEQLAYCGVFLALAWARLTTRDITS